MFVFSERDCSVFEQPPSKNDCPESTDSIVRLHRLVQSGQSILFVQPTGLANRMGWPRYCFSSACLSPSGAVGRSCTGRVSTVYRLSRTVCVELLPCRNVRQDSDTTVFVFSGRNCPGGPARNRTGVRRLSFDSSLTGLVGLSPTTRVPFGASTTAPVPSRPAQIAASLVCLRRDGYSRFSPPRRLTPLGRMRPRYRLQLRLPG